MSETTLRPARPLSLAEAVVPILALILLVGLSYFLFGDAGAKGPNQVALVIAALVATLIGPGTASRRWARRQAPASAPVWARS